MPLTSSLFSGLLHKLFRSALVLALLLLSATSISARTVKISSATLLDKLKGGWAGQTIGCTYGGPVEFRYNGRYIPDSVALHWDDGSIKSYFDRNPGLYDDVYMDLTFVEIMDRLGLDAPVDSLAQAFARAPYPLWHANQAARFNILNGIRPPQSGHWLNNPHADCIDFQIEADFAGLMSPAMPNSAAQICDRVGHIMNYGDGWYGGVYVAAMYSLAYVESDISQVVTKALDILPRESTYYQCIRDVINWYKAYPQDWHKVWQLCQDKYSHDMGCPECVYRAIDIDAPLNGAYVVIGLLYGQGDFDKTVDISTRCGQDADCNPATAAGILGTLIGYSHIPERWMRPLRIVEDRPFAYTGLSLLKTYQLSLKQAQEMIRRAGGRIKGDKVTLKYQTPRPVRLERSFEGLKLDRMTGFAKPRSLEQDVSFTFDGCGIAVKGDVKGPKDYVALVQVWLDDKLIDTLRRPASFHDRAYDLYWNYQIPNGRHTIRFHLANPQPKTVVAAQRTIYYLPADK